jgi:hypothetical protein
MRIINRTENLWRVLRDFMKVMNLTKSSWNSIWISHHGHQRVFNEVHQDHELYQKFRKECMEVFARIINGTKEFESVYERLCDNHQSYWEFMKENIKAIKWITNLFYRFLIRYENRFSLSITSKEFLKWWAEIFILWTWHCVGESYLNRPISPRIVEQLTDLSHYAKVII